MKIAIVQCPAWSVDRPSYAVALLSSLLKGSPHGHEVFPFDFNIEMYRRAEAEGKKITFTLAGKAEEKFGPESWSAWAIEWDWGKPQDVEAFMKANADYVEGCIDRILGTGVEAVGFSVHYTSKWFSLEMARRIKQRDPSRIILFGGPQCFPTCDANHLLEMNDFIDVMCIGEAEGHLSALLCDLERHGLKKREPYEKYRGYQIRLANGDSVHRKELVQPFTIDLNHLPMADWSWVDFSQYTRVSLPIITSRGCIRRCNFCSEAGAKTTSWGPYRYRNADKIMEEIRHQYGLYNFDYVWFTDSVFNGNVKMVEELCDLLIEADLDFLWDAQLTIRKDMTEELLVKMKQAGCQMIHWGLESGSNAVLKFMNKGYTTDLARTVVERTWKAGLRQNVNLIVGFPGEKEEHFQETLEFLRVLNQYDIVNPPVAPCDVNRGSNLWYMLDELDLDLGEDGKWFTRDGSNTYEIRMDRKRRMEQFLEGLIKPRSHEFHRKHQHHNVVAYE